MKKLFNFRTVIPLLLIICGCFQQATPPTEHVTSCSASGWAYSLVSNGNYLQVPAYTSLYSLSNPADPIPTGNSEFGLFDTTFMDSANEYNCFGSHLEFGPIASTGYPLTGTILSGYARHIAMADSLIYIIRHTTYPGTNIFCQQAVDSVNELDVDQFDSHQPNDTSEFATLLTKIPFTDPTDIAIQGSTLFVLDASTGLQIFSLSNPAKPALIAQAPNVQGYHIQVTSQSTLLVTSSSGLAQYDISDPASVTLLSKIQ
jgi:hypothetical protein